MPKKFLHDLPDAKDIFEAVVYKTSIENKWSLLPVIVEKDYWLMHCLWGLMKQDYTFELKGGTSLSRGFELIDRFSEDIDIQIHPKDSITVPIGKNQNNPSQIEERKLFFDKLCNDFEIPGLTFERDHSFDDEKLRSAGIRGRYTSRFQESLNTDADRLLKPGILLEVGFDQTTPNTPCDITSWAYETAKSVEKNLIDNRALHIPCYNPEYTLVEKMQAISTKYRKYIQDKR